MTESIQIGKGNPIAGLGGHALNRNFVRLLYDYARLEPDGKTCHPQLLAMVNASPSCDFNSL